MAEVGNGVGVAVGGNQTGVSVIVGLGSEVSVGGDDCGATTQLLSKAVAAASVRM
jgi:hypothetical protein